MYNFHVTTKFIGNCDLRFLPLNFTSASYRVEDIDSSFFRNSKARGVTSQKIVTFKWTIYFLMNVVSLIKPDPSLLKEVGVDKREKG